MQSLLRYKIELALIAFYLSLHLTNLTLIPPFNDESIYLDWGWTQIHMPGHLYESLYDAKQPLMMWLFGIFATFFPDPLYAGRFVSVLFGLAAMFGIYKLTEVLFNRKLAQTASLLYTIVPLFVFYNRQALMESAIACIGIWSFYGLLKLLQKPTTNRGVMLGMLLGVGFFTKTSSLLFIVPTGLIIIFFIAFKRKTTLIKPAFASLVSFSCVNILLFIHPVFWQTFPSNSRYSFTLTEIMTFPLTQWGKHLEGSFEIAFIFLTPLIFLAGIFGLFLMRKNKVKHTTIFLFYFLTALAIEIFSARFQNQRYITPFLPFLVISATYTFSLLWRNSVWKSSAVIMAVLPAFIATFLLIVNPDYYILQLSRISKYSPIEHIRGQMSGYGIKEVMQYIKEHSIPSKPSLVLIPLNSGNPENAVNLYSQKDPQLYGLHIDRSFFPGIEQYNCISSEYPVFLVTRYDQQVGFDSYFTQEKTFINPDGKYYLSIYTLKKNCQGSTYSISDIYQPVINKMRLMRY